ncbi:MAG: hypothetical protein KUG77_09085 [Nannocystaceae bacterium]|nr:hypothetical protein [Nannocystaceae bacterium]
MRTALLALSLAAGCATAGSPAPITPQAGTRIYSGDVFGPEQAPRFRYTRESRVDGDRWTSTHRSHDAKTGEFVVAQSAEHDASYALARYVEDHRQLGIQSEVIASDPGKLRYTTRSGNRVRHRSERIRDPAVTGPTLFGFVHTHWDRLQAGEEIAIRFVVAQRRRSYVFDLRMLDPSGDERVVQMRARGLFVRLSVPPMRMTFDSKTHAIKRYEGRVPPRWNGRALDARVEYQHAAPYR